MKTIGALVLLLLLAVSFQPPAFAQSDESEAIASRQQGFKYQSRGDFKMALFYYQRALALQPDSAATYNDIALMQEYSAANQDAEQNYLKAISLDHLYLPAYANLGNFYAKQGQYAQAARYLRQRVEKGRPDDPWTVKAQEDLDDVCRKVPALKSEQLRLQAEALDGKIVEAKDKMKRSAARNNTLDFEGAYLKGISEYTARRYDTAIESLETAVMLNPRSHFARDALRRAKFAREKSQIEAQAAMMQSEKKSRSVAMTLNSAAPSRD